MKLSLFGKTNSDAKPKGDGSKRFRFQFTTGGLIALSVVVVLGLTWVFVLGVLLGRGYRPEQAVPEIASMMPRAEEPARPVEPEVLKPEELDYIDNLSKRPTQTPTQAEPAPKPAPAPAHKPEPEPAPPPPASEAKTAEPAPAPAPPKAEPATESAARTMKVYQVASSQELPKAEALRDRIRALGLSADLESAQVKGATWHRVMVFVDDSPAAEKAMKDKLAGLKITNVLPRGTRQVR